MPRSALPATDSLAVPGYRQFGARTPEVGALANVLAYHGCLSPQTGQPPTEALLFGIGGGIGLGYFAYVSGEFQSLFLATRLTTERGRYLPTIADRLGLGARLHSASGASAAEKRLRQALAAGQPVIAWLDPPSLPYPAPIAYHAAVVYGLDDVADVVRLAERSDKPVTLSRAELATAQARGDAHFQMMVVETAPPLKIAALKKAVRQGLRDCLDQMHDGFGPANFRGNFGLKALEKWAALLVDERDPRGWPRFLPPGPRLLDALVSFHAQIEHRGRGRAEREVFADFLLEAAGLLGQPDLEAVAAQYRACARRWHGLAESLLPSRVPAFETLKLLRAKRNRLFRQRGTAALPDLQAIKAQQDELTTRLRAEFPWDAAQASRQRAALREQVLAIAAAERAAVTELARLIR